MNCVIACDIFHLSGAIMFLVQLFSLYILGHDYVGIPRSLLFVICSFETEPTF